MSANGLVGRYVSLNDARAASGVRLVVTKGICGPWAEAAKSLLHVKRVEHLRVHHLPGAENTELAAWVGCNSAPVLVVDDEPPRAGWAEILATAERIAPEPALIPANEDERVLMMGMAHALCGEDGFGWNRRLLYFASAQRMLAQVPDADRESFDRIRGKYGAGDDAHAKARLLSILEMLAARLGRNAYYLGSRLTALDIYSAAFMAMLRPLPEAVCSMSDELRASYTETDADLLSAAAPLLTHRDLIYERYLELPLRL
jgi:glutathione S-transferase